MEIPTLPDLSFSWVDIKEMLMTTGVEFSLNLVTAVLIFYFGKFIVGLLMRGLSTIMQAQEVDKTLGSFVTNLARMVLFSHIEIRKLFDASGNYEPLPSLGDELGTVSDRINR